MMVCTSTAFLILAAGTYNVYSPIPGAEPVFQGLAGIAEGAGYAQAAVESVIPGFGAAFVATAIFFFAFTTIMAYYYMAETNLTYVAGTRKTHPVATLLLRLAIVGMVVFGAYHDAKMAWTLGDIGVGVMAWLNVVAILILQKPALAALRDYERQKKLGLDPVFDPDVAGIRNADFWKKRV
jgi:AGCS family alanine or glycine:cation symporter